MALDATMLRLKLGSPATDILSADQATECLAEALRAISRSFGLPATETFVTVADQQLYDFPTIGVGATLIAPEQVIQIVWHPSGSPDALPEEFEISTATRSINAGLADFVDIPVQGDLDNLFSRDAMDRTLGSWHVDGDQIALDPVPSLADLDVVVQYRAAFANAAAVPVNRQDKFWLVAKAAAFEMMAAAIAPIREITDGSQKITLDGGKAWREAAAALRTQYERETR